MAAKNPAPQPVVVTTVCSLCGLAWELHGDTPTQADCIRLLKDELTKQPVVYRDWRYVQPSTWTYASGTNLYDDGHSISNTAFTNVVDFRRPDDDDGPSPVPAVI